MKTNKGFTLIEIAVVLAIIAILAAIMTPIVTSYIDQARITRAHSDTKKIATAVLLYKRDTGLWPAYDNLADARNDTNARTCLATSGVTAAMLVGWESNCASIGNLENYLNVNSVGVAGTGASPAGTGGVVAFRGPYLDGLQGLDPWGSAYVVTSGNLTGANHAFAVSAGPNSTFNTTFNQPTSGGFSTASDDIGAMIR